jgi:excisionase family DNA binding protein
MICGEDPNKKSLVALVEAARTLGVSVFTVRRLADRGELKTVNVGARRLVPVSELARVVASGVGKARRRIQKADFSRPLGCDLATGKRK